MTSAVLSRARQALQAAETKAGVNPVRSVVKSHRPGMLVYCVSAGESLDHTASKRMGATLTEPPSQRLIEHRPVPGTVAAAPGQATLLATPDELASQVTPYLLPGTVAQISGSMSALWAVAAAALGPEDWAVIAALPAAGLLAAAQAGLALNRTVVVPDLGACPPRVLAGLIDAFGLVIAGKLSLQASYRRRFEARLRFNGSKLITTGQWGGAKVVVDVDQTDCADLGECCGLADLPRLGYQLVCRATGAV